MDVGNLTGQVSIEDQLTDKLTEIANHVKEFSENFDGTIGSLAIGAGVFAAAVAGITISVVALGEEGSKILGVENAFDHLAESANTTGEALRGGLLAGVRNTIDDMQAMQSTVKLLGSGMKLTADQAQLMGSAARELGKATGGDASSGLDILSSALTTGRVRGLQQQIGLIDLAAGEKKFAESIGTTVDQLNEVGKLEGKRIAILDATKAYVDRLGESQLSFAEKIKQGQVAFDDWLDELRKGVASSTDVNAALDTIGAAVSKAFGEDKKSITEALLAGINAFARGVSDAIPYVVNFAYGIKDAWDFTAQFWPVVKLAAEAFVIYEGVLLLVEAKTIAYTAATWLANVATIAYEASMAMLAGETATFGGSLTTALGPIGLITIAVLGMVEGWKAAQKESGWVRELSDSFEYASLRVQGYSAAEADAMIATDHATQKALERTKGMTAQALGLERLGVLVGDGIQAENAAAAAEDNHRFISDKLTEAQKKKYAEALKEYASSSGGDYLSMVKQIGTAMYEGIIYDHERGKSTEVLAQIYGMTTQVIKDVIDAEKEADKQLKETIKDIEDFRKIGEAGAAAVAKGFAGMPLVLTTMAQSMGPLTLSAKTFAMQGALIGDRFTDATAAIDRALTESAKKFIPLNDAQRVTIDRMHELGFTGPEIADKLGVALNQVEKQTYSLGASIKTNLLDVLANIPGTIANALTGGGGLVGGLKAVGTMVGSTIGKDIGESIGKNAEGITQGIGKLAGPLGAAIGSLVGPLISWISNIGGPSTAEVAGRKVEATFEASMGGFQGMMVKVGAAYAAQGLSAAQASTDIQAMFAAEKLGGDAAAVAVNKVNDILNAQKQDAADLDAAIQKYGFSISELGQTMQRQKLTEQAVQLENDFRLLAGSGIDVDTVLGRMGSSINDFLHLAMQTGSEVPAEMEPMLQKMVDLGTLTDANGNAITDLGASGITFSQTMTQGFQSVVDKLTELINKISATTGALNALPAQKTVTIVYDDPGYTSGYQPAEMMSGGGIVYAASGASILPFKPKGTDVVPAMLTPGETVTSAPDVKSQAQSMADMTSGLSAIRQLLAGQPAAMAIALKDAIVLLPRRTA